MLGFHNRIIAHRRTPPHGRGRFSLFEDIRQVKLIFLVRASDPFVFPNGTDQLTTVTAVVVLVKLGTVIILSWLHQICSLAKSFGLTVDLTFS